MAAASASPQIARSEQLEPRDLYTHVCYGNLEKIQAILERYPPGVISERTLQISLNEAVYKANKFDAHPKYQVIIHLLLRNGADLNKQGDGRLPLTSLYGDPGPVAKALLIAGADPTLKDGYGECAMDSFNSYKNLNGELKKILKIFAKVYDKLPS